MTQAVGALPPPLDGAALTADADALPAAAGAYLLSIDLDRALAATIGSLGAVTLVPGTYLYAGSARGPGGIRARVRRHLAGDKTLHWHVDHLTTAATKVLAAGFVDDTECGLVRRLLAGGHVSAPHPGFGSSDCRFCPAHLLALD